jgi:hypothetical protein
VIIPAGSSARVVIDLERVDAPPGSGAPPVAREPAGPPPPIDVRTSTGGGSNWRWPAAWVSGGAAVLLAGAGVWGALTYTGKVKDFDAVLDGTPPRPVCSTAKTDSGGPKCAALLAEANQAKTIFTGAFVGAGVAAVLATVFFATAPSAEERLALSPCQPQLAKDGAGATCGWRF